MPGVSKCLTRAAVPLRSKMDVVVRLSEPGCWYAPKRLQARWQTRRVRGVHRTPSARRRSDSGCDPRLQHRRIRRSVCRHRNGGGEEERLRRLPVGVGVRRVSQGKSPGFQAKPLWPASDALLSPRLPRLRNGVHPGAAGFRPGGRAVVERLGKQGVPVRRGVLGSAGNCGGPRLCEDLRSSLRTPQAGGASRAGRRSRILDSGKNSSPPSSG